MIFQPVKFGMPKETLFFFGFWILTASLQVLVEPHIQIGKNTRYLISGQTKGCQLVPTGCEFPILWHPVEGSGIHYPIVFQVKIFGYPKTSQNILGGIWIGLLVGAFQISGWKIQKYLKPPPTWRIIPVSMLVGSPPFQKPWKSLCS